MLLVPPNFTLCQLKHHTFAKNFLVLFKSFYFLAPTYSPVGLMQFWNQRWLLFSSMILSGAVFLVLGKTLP